MKLAGPIEVSEQALTRLIALVREETGNVIPRARHGFLEEIAARRARTRGFGRASEYVAALAAGALEGEWEQLVPLVTVKESYFFRAPQQFGSIERHVLPRVLEARGRERTLTLWSAAAARGEEPATLAMILMEHEALASWDWRIVATDLDADALAAGRRGLYGERAVAQVPERLLERWFLRRGSLFELDPAIRRRIEYRPVNLARPPYKDLPAERFDLILLRNVLIYFRRPLQRRVMTEVAGHLASHGYLFLGASETLWQIHDLLEPVELYQCFGYRHPPPGTERQRPVVPARPARRPASPPRPPRPKRPAPGRTSSETSAELQAEPVVADEVPPEPEPPPSLPPEGGSQDLLLEAAQALAANRLDEAVERVSRAREADPSEPTVYALEGFLHDLAARTDEAASSYRAALYLDPTLYQVRVLLADCLRRLGHRERAEHEFRQVLASLDRGGARDLVLLEELPFPNRTRALRHCRQALGRR